MTPCRMVGMLCMKTDTTGAQLLGLVHSFCTGTSTSPHLLGPSKAPCRMLGGAADTKTDSNRFA